MTSFYNDKIMVVTAKDFLYITILKWLLQYSKNIYQRFLKFSGVWFIFWNFRSRYCGDVTPKTLNTIIVIPSFRVDNIKSNPNGPIT